MRDAVNGIACPTAKLCLAPSANKMFWTTKATGGKGKWKNAALEDSQGGSVILTDVTCASKNLCVAVDNLGNGFVATKPAGGKNAWHPVYISSIEIESVGCSASGDCAALDYYGNVFSTTTPSTGWTIGNKKVGTGAGSDGGVGCAHGLCAVTSGTNKIATTTKPGSATWKVTKVKGSSQWSDVACPSAHRCVAVGSPSFHGKVAVSKGAGGWKHASLGQGGGGGVDCASASSCFIISDYFSSHPKASKHAWKPVAMPSLGSQTGVSCPTPRRCFIGTSTNQFTVGNR